MPPIVISPSSTSQNLAIRFAIVVFPDPEGPTIAVFVFSGSTKEIFFNTFVSS